MRRGRKGQREKEECQAVICVRGKECLPDIKGKRSKASWRDHGMILCNGAQGRGRIFCEINSIERRRHDRLT